MIKSRIDIAQFDEDAKYFGRINLILTVKSFDLKAIRKRYLASRGNKSGRAGSVERRQAAIGGIVSLVIEGNKIVEEEILCRLPEPRGIDSRAGCLAIAAENKIFVLDGHQIEQIENSWFSYIHTVNFSRGGHHLLISSSGLDCIFDWSLNSKQIRAEWFAWEHGFDQSIDASGQILRLTRSANQASAWQKEGIACRFIDQPEKQVLPTAQRAAFINSVVYDDRDPAYWLATFFHEGKVYRINPVAGIATPVLEGLSNPHGGRAWQRALMATSTTAGMVIIKSSERELMYDFTHLPGKANALTNMEWIQNTIVSGNTFISIDSNRAAFHLFDPVAEKRISVAFNPDWAVQDLVAGKLKKEVIHQAATLAKR